LRRVPELVFVLDHSAEDAHRIEFLLDQAHKNS
jgi:ribosome-binding factor A